MMDFTRQCLLITGEQYFIGRNRLAGAEGFDTLIQTNFVLYHNRVILWVKNLYVVKGGGFYLDKGASFNMVKVCQGFTNVARSGRASHEVSHEMAERRTKWHKKERPLLVALHL
jgi:hypothetical protein